MSTKTHAPEQITYQGQLYRRAEQGTVTATGKLVLKFSDAAQARAFSKLLVNGSVQGAVPDELSFTVIRDHGQPGPVFVTLSGK